MVSESRDVPKPVAEGICGFLFGIAIFAAATRTIIRFRTKAQLALDDILLFIASVLLVISAILFYKFVPGAYGVNQLEYDPPLVLPSDFGPTIVYNTRILDSHTVISWSVIFTVKFCFLSFFRALIDRVRHLIIYWKFVIGVTLVFAVYSISVIFISCPHISVVAAQCMQGAGFNRSMAVAISVMLLDITTDVLIISIPLCLLWNVRIRFAQKFGIGVFLCLSIFMIMVAIIKVAGLSIPGKGFDLVWDIFWQQVKASVAVTTVSFTAFRSILNARKSRAVQEKGRSAYPSFLRFFRRNSSERVGNSPGPSPHSPGPSPRGERSTGEVTEEVQIKSQQSQHWWNVGIVSNINASTEEV